MTDFLGAGWAFPVGVDARGRIAVAREEQDIEHDLALSFGLPGEEIESAHCKTKRKRGGHRVGDQENLFVQPEVRLAQPSH